MVLPFFHCHLANRQATFLEALAAAGDEAWASGQAALAPVLQAKADLAAEALALAKSKGG